MLEGAVTDLKLETTWQVLRERVSVAVPVQNARLVFVTVRAATPQEAARTAAAYAHTSRCWTSGPRRRPLPSGCWNRWRLWRSRCAPPFHHQALAALVGLILGIVLLYVLEVHYWVMRSRAEVESVPDDQAPSPVPVPADQAAASEPPERASSDLAF